MAHLPPPHFVLNLSFGLFLIFVCCVGELRAQRRLDLTQYELTWSDEFSYPSKTEMFNPSTFNNNKAKWRSNLHEDPIEWFNGSPRGTYTPDAISLVTKIENGQPNGYVELTPSYHSSFPVTGNNGTVYMLNRKSAGLAAIYDGDYPCNLLSGWDLGGFYYGIFEIRAKLPNQTNDYAAFWLWNGYYDCTDGSGQGRCGEPGSSYTTCRDANLVCSNMEIDVFETSRKDWQDNNRFDYFATIQANFNNTNPSEQCLPCATWYNWNGSNPWETYHTYTVAWTPTSMTWYLDGVEIRTQNGNIPPWRLKLFLTNINWGADLSDPLSVDYIRVYRPKLPTTGTPLVNYTYHPASALRSYEPGTRSFDNPEAPLPVNYVAPGPKEVVYRNAWASKPHNTMQGYDAMKKVVYASTSNATNEVTSMAFYKPSTSALQVFYLDQVGNIYQMIEPSGGFGASSQVRSLMTSTANGLASLSINPSTNELLFVTGTGNIMVKNLTVGLTSGIKRLNPTTGAATDRAMQIEYAPAYGGIPERVYYIDFDDNLRYYEKVGTAWVNKGLTNVVGISEFVVRAAAPGYRLYAVFGHHLKEIYPVGTSPQNWTISDMSGTNSPAMQDCHGGLALTSDKKRLYYKSFETPGRDIIKYWDISALSPAQSRKQEEPTDVHIFSKLVARNISASKYEVFYVSVKGRIKVHYDRLSGYNPATVNGGSYIPGKLTTSLQTFSEDDLNASTVPNPADCPNCTEMLPFLAVYNAATPLVFGQRSNSLSMGTSVPAHKPIGVHYWASNLQAVSPPNNLANCNAFNNTYGVEALTSGGSIETNDEAVSPIEGELMVYPNPSDGMIYTAVATDGECEIIVVDQLGKVVYKNVSSSNTSRHDLSHLPKGLYFARLQQGFTQFTKTFLLR